jgi:PAS domain S-box-containing protein
LTHLTTQTFEAAYQSVSETIPAALFICQGTQIVYANPIAASLTGYSQPELLTLQWQDIVHPEFRVTVSQGIRVQQQQDWLPSRYEFKLLTKTGEERWFDVSTRAIEFARQPATLAVAFDVTEYKRIEQAAQQQRDRERLVWKITQNIRCSLDLETILQTTVSEVREFLQTDRVLIYRFEPDWSGIVAVESVISPELSLLGSMVRDPCFEAGYSRLYQQGRFQAISDLATANLPDCYRDFLQILGIKAVLIVPIIREQKLWGLLIAHHCRAPHQWQPIEIDLLQQLASQVGIAIQQSGLYQQLQSLNSNLEHQVQIRTAQVQQALDFEARLQRITDKVRDSLDETQILQTAVQELALGLGVECCDTALYNAEKTTSTIFCDYIVLMPSARGSTLEMSIFPEAYRQLLQGQYMQFCPMFPSATRPVWDQTAILACPIMDKQEVMGDLWLFKEKEQAFNDLEVRLVQQVANHCAIALRQARLYRTAQAQVEELERLNQLKDDFLSTVSHELRTPMSNIKMAIQMLEIVLRQAGILDTTATKAANYFQILQDECHRETTLINDLLKLSRLEAGSEPLNLTPIDLKIWLPHIAEVFESRIHNQQQQLQLLISSDLPPLVTDLAYLERVVMELLNNACKYTPAGEIITLSACLGCRSKEIASREIAAWQDDRILSTLPPSHCFTNPAPHSPPIQISVTNTGTEIPEQERDRVFDKFYRIPNNDPWKHGGTGLGLALVKKILEHLHARIWIETASGATSFIVEFPR